MKIATVRDLRYDFPRIESWLQSGEQIEITKRGRAIARLVPAAKTPKRLVKPDILAQLREIWGERVFTGQEVAQMRSAELEGQEG
jgi:antitoxin (DNA-binding transcriptional repressor) of toxin-antitoxin stability system